MSLDDVREAAVGKAVCPISLVDLRERPCQVGAFVRKGHRVEPALYHRDSVLGEDGRTLFSGGLTPVSRQPFDGFQHMPLLPAEGASVEEWKDFIRFFHWTENEWVLVAEVATAFAAATAVDEDGVSRYIRNHFDVDCDGHIQRQELEEQIVPHLSRHLDELQIAAPVTVVPRLWRHAGRADVLRWFDFWDQNRSGEVEVADFRFAVASTLYKALGSDVDADAKEAVAVFFLAEAVPDGSRHISRAKFIDRIFPALQANLPDLPNGCHSLQAESRGNAYK